MPRRPVAPEGVDEELEDVELIVDDADVGGAELETGEPVEENDGIMVEDSVDEVAEETAEELADGVTGDEDMTVEDANERVDVVEAEVDDAREAEDSAELAVLLPDVELPIEDSFDEATELTVDTTELLPTERATEDTDEEASVEATELLDKLLANEEAVGVAELLTTGAAVDAEDDGARKAEDDTSTVEELVVDNASDAGVELAEVSTTVEDGASDVDWASVLEAITSLLVLGVGVALAEPKAQEAS